MRLTAVVALLSLFLLPTQVKADLVYGAFDGVSGFSAPSPFAPRILDFITLDQDGYGELDGLRLGFTVTNASDATPQNMVVYVQFWDNVDYGSDDPLANAVSLGTEGINFGSRTANGGFGGGISSGLAGNSNDIILPGNTMIGVEFRFRSDSSTFQPNISGRLANGTPTPGSTTTDYYIDSGLNGFDGADFTSKDGKIMRFEISTIAAVPEPGSAMILGSLGLVGLVYRRKRS